MVIDKIENYRLYTDLSERVSKAFDFIVTNDLKKMELGKYEIEGDEIFALLQEYETKEIADCKLESHFKYIDLQYMVCGSEQMGVASMNNHIPIEKNEEADFAFYSEDGSLMKMEEGMFAIFFTHDLHMPGLKIDEVSKIRKVVVKIRV